MANTAVQEVTGATRWRGPTIVTLRGAGSAGHDSYGGTSQVGGGYDVAQRVQVPTNQTANIWQAESPDAGPLIKGNATNAAALLAAIDAAGGLLLSSSMLSSRRVVRVALTAANLIAMYTTPVLILAHAAAGVAIVVDKILFEMTTTATAFTSGGVVTFQYATTTEAGGTIVHAGSIPASVVTAAAGVTTTGLWAASGSNGLTIPSDGTSASGIYISNATGVFATGTGTAIVTMSYDLVTLG